MLTLKDYVNWGITHCDKVGSADGIPLVLENCVKNKKMKQLEVYGQSVQNGTPSPEAPVEVESVGEKCTKNLFDYEKFEAELQHGYILNEDGIKTNDTISTYSTYRIPIYAGQPIHIYGWFQRFYVYDANDVFVRRIGNSGITAMSSAYTPTEDGYIRLQIKNVNYNANKGKEQIEEGSVATDYEPYGKYKIPVTVRGKNLYDSKSYPITQGYYIHSGNGSYNSNASFAATQNFIPCDSLQGKMITINHTGGSNPGIAFYNNNKGYLSGKANGSSANTSISVVVPNNAYYYRFCVQNSYADVAMVEYGNAPTDYEPYVEPITTNVYLNEPLRSADVLDFRAKKVKRVDTVEDVECELPILTAKTSIIEINTSILPSNIKGKYIKR